MESIKAEPNIKTEPEEHRAGPLKSAMKSHSKMRAKSKVRFVDNVKTEPEAIKESTSRVKSELQDQPEP